MRFKFIAFALFLGFGLPAISHADELLTFTVGTVSPTSTFTAGQVYTFDFVPTQSNFGATQPTFVQYYTNNSFVRFNGSSLYPSDLTITFGGATTEAFSGATMYSGTSVNPMFPTETYSLTGSGDIYTATASLSQTPEPSSLVLLGTGILGLAGAARRRLVRA